MRPAGHGPLTDWLVWLFEDGAVAVIAGCAFGRYVVCQPVVSSITLQSLIVVGRIAVLDAAPAPSRNVDKLCGCHSGQHFCSAQSKKRSVEIVAERGGEYVA